MPGVSQFLNHGDIAVYVFCKGDHLDLREGWTGYWRINPARLQGVNMVVVYLRDENSNIIYKGNFGGWRPAPQGWPRRITILVDDFREVGGTNDNWLEFGNGSSNPVQIFPAL